MGRRESMLFVTASPDDRPSTEDLRTLVTDVRSRGIRAELWYLRGGTRERGPGERVLDDLRTWSLPTALQLLGLRIVADRLRGARLRVWQRMAGPTVVVLDDGLGARVAPRSNGLLRVVRANPRPPADLADEPRVDQADLVIVGPGADRPAIDAPRWAPIRPAFDLACARAHVDPTVRATTRARLAIEPDRPVVTGWGSDLWIDGIDRFVRSLWALEQHEGIAAHGLWLATALPREDRARIEAEVARCGLTDRFTLSASDSEAARVCGDVVHLPVRWPLGDLDPGYLGTSGMPVVTTPSPDPVTGDLPPFDPRAAAASIRVALAIDRRAASVAHIASTDLTDPVKQFLDAIAAAR